MKLLRINANNKIIEITKFVTICLCIFFLLIYSDTLKNNASNIDKSDKLLMTENCTLIYDIVMNDTKQMYHSGMLKIIIYYDTHCRGANEETNQPI